MKTSLLHFAITASLLALSPSLWAGVEKFNSDEFNSIITDNLKAEKDLNTQLETNTGIPDFEKQVHPDYTRQVVGIVEAESVASPTTDHVVPRRDHSNSKQLFEKNLKRVSQELDSSGAE